METVRDTWERFRIEAIKNDIPASQVESIEAIFYAGAISLLRIVAMGISEKDSIFNVIIRLTSELSTTGREIVKELGDA